MAELFTSCRHGTYATIRGTLRNGGCYASPWQGRSGNETFKSMMNLVFLHGAGSSADFWHRQRPAFPGAHYLDLPGHGRSATSSGEAAVAAHQPLLEHYAGWVERYVEQAGLREVVLNGHSMGGAIALILALRRPSWLRSIILTSTGARLEVSHHLLELLRTDYRAAVDAIVESSFAPAGPIVTYARKVRLNGTRRRLLRTPREVTLADYEACEGLDLTARVCEIDLPALCIVGAQDAVTLVEQSEYLHNAIRGSRLEVVEGAGHMLPVEKPEEYNSAVEQFTRTLRPE